MVEFFEGFVDGTDGDRLLLQVRSREGEEGVAELEFASVPASERQHVRLGAPIRIARIAYKSPDGRERQRTEIRLLRYSQYAPSSPSEAASDLLLSRMKAALSEK